MLCSPVFCKELASSDIPFLPLATTHARFSIGTLTHHKRQKSLPSKRARVPVRPRAPHTQTRKARSEANEHTAFASKHTPIAKPLSYPLAANENIWNGPGLTHRRYPITHDPRTMDVAAAAAADDNGQRQEQSTSLPPTSLREQILAMRKAKQQESNSVDTNYLRPTPGRSGLASDPSSGVLTWCVQDTEASSEDEELMASGQPLFDHNIRSSASAGHSSGSAGHSGHSAEESTILGHQTMASLLNNSNNAPPPPQPRQSTDSTPSTSSGSNATTPATSARRSTSRGSSVASGSKSSKAPTAMVSAPSPPPKEPLPRPPPSSAGSSHSSRRRSNSSHGKPAHGPPNEKLPDLPPNAARPGTADSHHSNGTAGRRKARVSSSSSSSVTSPVQSSFRSKFSSATTPTWTAELGGRQEEDSPTDAFTATDTETDMDQQQDKHRLSVSTTSSSSSKPRKQQKGKASKASLQQRPSLQSILDDAERRRKSLMHKSIGGLISALDHEVDVLSETGSMAEASGSRSGGDQHTEPSQSPSPSSPSSPHLDLRRPSTSTDRSRPTSTNTAFFAMYDGATTGTETDDNDEHERGASSNGNTSRHVPRSEDPATPTRAAPTASSATSTPKMPPSISIDAADSDETISADDDSDFDGPRKKVRQKSRGRSGASAIRGFSSTGGGFDEQRAAPSRSPSMNLLGGKSGPQPGPLPASPPSDENPFAYYAFSPDLPPFVPQGLKPMDLTGRGTWMSIAARAGGFGLGTSSMGLGTPSLSRSPSPAASSVVPHELPSVSQPSPAAHLAHESSRDSLQSTASTLATPPALRKGPVSMRELAAQTRAKQKQAEEFREKQASILAQKKWAPFDIHDHAARFAENMASSDSIAGDPDTRSPTSVYEGQFPRSRQSSQSFSALSSHLSLASLAQSDVQGKAFNFDPHVGGWSVYGARHAPNRSEASVGGDADMPWAAAMRRTDSVASGTGSSGSGNDLLSRKQYREFSQQTTPPSSPGPEERPLKMRSEAGVGADEDAPAIVGVGADSRSGRQKREQVVSTSTLQGLSLLPPSDGEGEEDGQNRSRTVTPTPPKQMRARRSLLHSLRPNAEDEELDVKSLRAPRLSSRRSNIGTSPLRKAGTPNGAAGTRKGIRSKRSPLSKNLGVDADYLAGGETTDGGHRDGSTAGSLSSGSSSVSDSDEDDSGESDLDLTTPLNELALKTGAFDAIVQARGSKRKLKEPKAGAGRLILPGAARRIAGSSRVSKVGGDSEGVAGNATTAEGKLGSPPLISEKATLDGSPMGRVSSQMDHLNIGTPNRLSALRSSAALRRVSSAQQLQSSKDLNTRLLHSRKSFSHRSSMSSAAANAARPDSPDLEESFATDMHSDEDEDDGDLLLSEIEFPEPVTGLGVRVGRGPKGRAGSRSPLPAQKSPATTEDTPSPPVKARAALSTTSGRSPLEVIDSPSASSAMNDTPMTNMSSGMWSTLADSNRASTATTMSLWSQNSGGSGGSDKEKRKSGGDDEHTAAGVAGKKASEDKEGQAGNATAPAEAVVAAAASPKSAALPVKPDGPVSANESSVAKTPVPAKGRSSLPPPSSYKLGGGALGNAPGRATPVRRPSEPVGASVSTPAATPLKSALKSPTNVSSLPTRASTVRGAPPSAASRIPGSAGGTATIARTPGIKAPSSLPTTPGLRKAASLAHLSPGSPVDRRLTPSPGGGRSTPPVRYSPASPSMAVPDTTRPVGGGIPRPASSLSNKGGEAAATSRRPSEPMQLRAGGVGRGIPSQAVIRRPSEQRRSATMSPPPVPTATTTTSLPVPRRRPSVHFAPVTASAGAKARTST